MVYPSTMATVKDLRAIAKQYGLPNRSELNKDGLIKAIAEVRAAEFQKRLKRAMKTGRSPSVRSDVEKPHKRGRRARELAQLDTQVDAALRANKYMVEAYNKPQVRQKPLRNISHRQVKPHLHGLTRSKKETLARVIAREGPDILRLDPVEDYVLYIDDGPVRFPDGGYAKKGVDINRKEIVEAVGGHRPDLRVTKSGPDITDEGEVYWVSYEGRRMTMDLASEVLELVDPETRYLLFTVVGKAANEPLAPVTEEVGRSEHRIKGGRWSVETNSAPAPYMASTLICGKKDESTLSSSDMSCVRSRSSKVNQVLCLPPSKRTESL
jgi:hypothetical protein